MFPIRFEVLISLCGLQVIWKKMELMSMESKISIMGLYGMGGIGKTTICKALCNELSQRFNEKVCHIELESASAIEMLRKALKKLTYKRHDILDEVDDIRQVTSKSLNYHYQIFI